MPAPVDFDEQGVAEALRGIFASPPFAGADSAPSWWAGLRAWCEAGLASLYSEDPVLFSAVVTGVSLVMLIGIWQLVAMLRSARQDVMQPQSKELVGTPSPTVQLQAARQALGVGDTRLAVELALCAVAARHARVEALTPRQWAAGASDALPGAPLGRLRWLVQLHEAVCYGGHHPSPAQAEAAMRAAELLLGGAP